MPSEKIVGETLILRQRIQRRDCKCIPRSFCIRRSYYRRVYIQISVGLKILMDSHRRRAAHTHNSLKEACTRSQMRYLTQKFQRMLFRLQRIGFLTISEQFNSVCSYLYSSGSADKRPSGLYCAPVATASISDISSPYTICKLSKQLPSKKSIKP